MLVIALALAAGCQAPPVPAVPLGTDVSGGLLGAGIADPFPNAFLVEDGVVTLDSEWFGGFDPSMTPTRSGFSAVQGSVLSMAGVDDDALPTWGALAPGEGGVVGADLTAGRFIAVHAELDATVSGSAEPLLLVQPMEPVPDGHRVAYAVLTSAAPRPARFEAILNGTPPVDFEGGVVHTQELVAELRDLGIASDTIALAWDFPVDDGSSVLQSTLAQLETPTSWDFYQVLEGEDVANNTWRYARANLQVQDFLVDDWLLAPDLQVTGTTDATVIAVIPQSVVDAGGARGLMIYGHGALGHPAYDLNTDDVSHPAIVAAEENELIILATTWRGLEYNDWPDVFSISTDPMRAIGITHRLLQGHLNTQAMIRAALEGDLLQDPVFEGLASSDYVAYYGVSLGTIMGTGLLANGLEADAAALQIGGGAFAWLLSRAADFGLLLGQIEGIAPDPLDRQRFWGLVQLNFDPLEPSVHAGRVDTPALMFENMGDDICRNGATELLARAMGAALVEPAHSEPYGLPSDGGGSWLLQYDPELGVPAVDNAPIEDGSGAHYDIIWPGSYPVGSAFLDPDSPGTLVFPCGSQPCSASNPGR
jgi:hypothetical protein